jgi:hypothetical protein
MKQMGVHRHMVESLAQKSSVPRKCGKRGWIFSERIETSFPVSEFHSKEHVQNLKLRFDTEKKEFFVENCRDVKTATDLYDMDEDIRSALVANDGIGVLDAFHRIKDERKRADTVRTLNRISDENMALSVCERINDTFGREYRKWDEAAQRVKARHWTSQPVHDSRDPTISNEMLKEINRCAEEIAEEIAEEAKEEKRRRKQNLEKDDCHHNPDMSQQESGIMSLIVQGVACLFGVVGVILAIMFTVTGQVFHFASFFQISAVFAICMRRKRNNRFDSAMKSCDIAGAFLTYNSLGHDAAILGSAAPILRSYISNNYVLTAIQRLKEHAKGKSAPIHVDSENLCRDLWLICPQDDNNREFLEDTIRVLVDHGALLRSNLDTVKIPPELPKVSPVSSEQQLQIFTPSLRQRIQKHLLSILLTLLEEILPDVDVKKLFVLVCQAGGSLSKFYIASEEQIQRVESSEKRLQAELKQPNSVVLEEYRAFLVSIFGSTIDDSSIRHDILGLQKVYVNPSKVQVCQKRSSFAVEKDIESKLRDIITNINECLINISGMTPKERLRILTCFQTYFMFIRGMSVPLRDMPATETIYNIPTLIQVANEIEKLLQTDNPDFSAYKAYVGNFMTALRKVVPDESDKPNKA